MDIIDDEIQGIKCKLNFNTYVALGSFDGLHVGHMKLINRTIDFAKNNGGKSMVYTFKNHPLSVINKDLAPKLLMDNETKEKVLEKSGIDILNFINFDKEFMKLSPEEFILNLVEKFNVKGIVVGFNYRFGYRNLGDTTLLKDLSQKYNFKLSVVEPVKFQEDIVSSSRIRNLIANIGDVKKASEMLLRPFLLSGFVVKGNQIGRSIGFPTINLNYNKNFIIPKQGVYFTIVEYKNSYYKGITNIGYNPTVNNKNLTVETHILNFHKDIYDEYIKVYFIDRIRDEKKFDSLEKLAKRIDKDKEFVENQNLELIIKNNLQT